MSATLSHSSACQGTTTTMTTPALREALNDAISSGKFVDTKIVLFSRRDDTGRVCKPKALYANSHVLKSVPYFKDCEFPLHPSTAREITLPPLVLFGTFVEAEIRDFSETVSDELAEDYGYSSDSDLEEDWDLENPRPAGVPTAGGPRKKKSSYGQYTESTLAGKIIKVQDIAFIT